MTVRPTPRPARAGRVPPQPVFLESGLRYRVRVFAGDFVEFTLGLLYYVALGTLGLAAVALDSVLRTRLYDAFIALVERIDHGKSPS
ncbi:MULTISPECIES: hypothetical protein [unclassified Rhodococcus (in: high G+C Gram-positive bacteria)]|uniref:hypothetical protein n=1 Tax=unclassified Rhodococcus (in: high G+C Gram-positive bacteria) TaxID=192944 RepID=UPI000B0CEEF8|nr:MULTISPECIES: hypothetical protein [unclassified Rhodococcus (in: high G+C Gram-positive bacteria)]